MFAHPTCSLKIPSASSQGMGIGFGLDTMVASTGTLERITLSALKDKTRQLILGLIQPWFWIEKMNANKSTHPD